MGVFIYILDRTYIMWGVPLYIDEFSFEAYICSYKNKLKHFKISEESFAPGTGFMNIQCCAGALKLDTNLNHFSKHVEMEESVALFRGELNMRNE